MKNIIWKILLFGFGVILISSLLSYVIPIQNFANGNHIFAQKLSRLKVDKNVNTIFFGSSLTATQINPNIIDSIIGRDMCKSYNLGVVGTSQVEQYYLIEKFLEAPPEGVKNIVIELGRVGYIKDENMFNSRVYYALTASGLKFTLLKIIDEENSIRFKAELAYKYIANFIFKNLSLYKVKLCLPQVANNDIQSSLIYDSGYCPMDRRYEIDDSGNLERRRQHFLNNIKLYNSRSENISNAYSENIDKSYLSKTHIRKLNSFFNSAKRNNINVYYIIPPRLGIYDNIESYFVYKELVSLKERLPLNSVIDMGNPDTHPSFYNENYIFDSLHLNEEGSKTYSHKIANEFKKRLR